MATARVLNAIKKATTEAILDFTPVVGQSVMRQICNIGAAEAGINSTQVHNGKYNGEHGASYFTVETDGVKEDHYFVKKSALLEYIIVRTYPKDKQSMETVYRMQMPQITSQAGGETSASGSKNKNKK